MKENLTIFFSEIYWKKNHLYKVGIEVWVNGHSEKQSNFSGCTNIKIRLSTSEKREKDNFMVSSFFPVRPQKDQNKL